MFKAQYGFLGGLEDNFYRRKNICTNGAQMGHNGGKERKKELKLNV